MPALFSIDGMSLRIVIELTCSSQGISIVRRWGQFEGAEEVASRSKRGSIGLITNIAINDRTNTVYHLPPTSATADLLVIASAGIVAVGGSCVGGIIQEGVTTVAFLHVPVSNVSLDPRILHTWLNSTPAKMKFLLLQKLTQLSTVMATVSVKVSPPRVRPPALSLPIELLSDRRHGRGDESNLRNTSSSGPSGGQS